MEYIIWHSKKEYLKPDCSLLTSHTLCHRKGTFLKYRAGPLSFLFVTCRHISWSTEFLNESLIGFLVAVRKMKAGAALGKEAFLPPSLPPSLRIAAIKRQRTLVYAVQGEPEKRKFVASAVKGTREKL